MTDTDANTQSLFQYVAVAPNQYFYTFAKVCFPIRFTAAILGISVLKHEFGDRYINMAADDIEEDLPFLQFKHSDKCWYLQNTKLWAQPVYLHQLQNLYQRFRIRNLPSPSEIFENSILVASINFFQKPLGKINIENLVQELMG